MSDVEQAFKHKILQAKLEKVVAERARAELLAVMASREAQEQEEEYRLAFEQREQARKKMKEAAESQAQERRPSRVFWIDLYFDEEEQLFVCARSGIRAKGASPEQACENFDKLWEEGYYRL
jgi:hypothetical protein